MPLNKAELIAFAQKHKDETNTEELVSNSLYDIEQHLRADLPVVLDMVLKRSIDKENQINLLLDLSNEFVISLVPFGCWEAPYGIYNRGPQNSRVPNSLIQAIYSTNYSRTWNPRYRSVLRNIRTKVSMKDYGYTS